MSMLLYRERNRARKEKEVRDFHYELSRNMKLKSAYDKKTDTIRKLKAYYLKCLHSKKYKCVEAKKEIAGTKTASTAAVTSLTAPIVTPSEVMNRSASSTVPMVTIKSEEADLIMKGLKTEVEDDPKCLQN